MKTNRWVVLAGLVGMATMLVAPPAQAHRRRPVPSRPAPWSPAIDTYTSFKLGGFGANGTTDAGGSGSWGLFFGAEWGIEPVPNLDLGLSMDWFHREDTRGSVLAVDGPYALPVELVAADGTSTDLLPFGVVVRAKFPVGDGRLAPFVAGHLSYDVLRLSYSRLESDGSYAVLAENTEWFHGMGAGFSTGIEAALGPGVAAVFEAGLHQSDPHKNLIIDGVPVQARADADGEFVRAGVKLSF